MPANAMDITGTWNRGSAAGRTCMIYDVIILDLMIPGLDGLSVLRQLRAGGRQTHVLILTARDAIEDRVLGLRTGGDDYLTKPFAFDELLARIQALSRRSHQSKNPIIQIGDLQIDTAGRTASRRGETISSGGMREYAAMLEFLALRAGRWSRGLSSKSIFMMTAWSR